MRNAIGTLAKIPGAEGWHRSGGRLFVRMADGSNVTFQKGMTPTNLRAEATRLRLRADIADALAESMDYERSKDV